ncbi:putative esterase YcpF (UPF0227 family) [Chitinophaga sp. W2I13]|uniref:hypothetical protein n=1 Tax=Chitinophaga sp. W2I13 TaxID=3373923 RepID=UPI003D1C9610
MKQAKFALTAVAVLAVVGGALAFKASRGETLVGFYATTATAQCTIPTAIANRTLQPNGAGVTTLFSVISTTKPCPVVNTYVLQ